jgi:GTP diphosphokinase / guanosine-3',5'-bis(diphosphate) 3'-diphosphatase
MEHKVLDKIREYNRSFDEEKAKGVLDLIRNSGVDTIEEHPSYIDMIDSLIPLRPDEDTLIAALLHRVYENDLVDEQIIEDVCGIDVLGILSGVKKLESLIYVENDRASQVENLRKMILVMAKDIRVILVALTCRLYKMRKLENFMDKDGIKTYSAETLNLYVPVCARLGIYTFKSKLEDLAFKYLFADDYKDIDDQLEELRSSCHLSIAYIKERLEDFLEARGVEADISGRIKNHYSIYRKLGRKSLNSVNDLDDIFAMRIVLPAKKTDTDEEVIDHLYAVLGLVHGEWKPVSKRFKDYLAVAKPNGYRSLHTVVLGIAPKDMDQPVEIQIRDSDMHREAEYGIASHWFYKESGGSSVDVHSQEELIRGLEGIRSEFDLEYDVLKEVEIDLFKDRIFVLTPRGEVKELNAEANVIDFAYSVHTDIGNKCVMAKVNGKIVPLDHELQNNDVVEIITRKDAKPRLRWLSMVKTNQAKTKIKSWFSSQNKENNVKEGRNLLNAQLERLGKVKLDQNYSVLKSYTKKALTLSQRESLVEEVGNGAKMASDIIRKVFPYKKSVIDKVVRPRRGRKFVNMSEQALLEDQILVGGEDGLPLKIAACCKPRFRDKVVGYVTRGQSITIHRQTCSMLDSLKSERIIFADWKGATSDQRKYLVGIKVKAMIRVGLMSDLTSTISDFDILIRDISIDRARNDVSEEFFLLEFDELDVFDKLMDKIEGVKGVLKVSKDDRTKKR